MLSPLAQAILYTVSRQATADPALKDRHVYDAFALYHNHFIANATDPDAELPAVGDARSDALVDKIWDLIVDREELGLEDVLTETTSSIFLNGLYVATFAELMGSMGRRGYKRKFIDNIDGNYVSYDYRWLAETDGVRVTPYNPYPEPLAGAEILRQQVADAVAVPMKDFTPEVDITALTDLPPGRHGIYYEQDWILLEEYLMRVAAHEGEEATAKNHADRLTAFGVEVSIPEIRRKEEPAEETPTPKLEPKEIPKSEAQTGAKIVRLPEHKPQPIARPTPTQIIRVKLSLVHSNPQIWRRLELPSTMTIPELHQVIQTVMDWDDSHLHQFAHGRDFFGPPDPDGVTESIDYEVSTIAKFLGHPGERLKYTYDLGDNWEHLLETEAVEVPDPGVKYPRCTEGEMAAPLEDSGGVHGYIELVGALNDSDHPSHRYAVDWTGGSFDPIYFSVDEVNGRLH